MTVGEYLDEHVKVDAWSIYNDDETLLVVFNTDTISGEDWSAIEAFGYTMRYVESENLEGPRTRLRVYFKEVSD